MTRFGDVAAAFLCAVAALTAYTPNARGQMPDVGKTLLDARVPSFVIRGGTLLDGLAQLSAEPVEISFAFEDSLKARVNDPPVPESRFDLRLEKRTIKEILDELCRMDGRYTWARDGSMINVYPRATINDKSYLLNRRLKQLELRGVREAGQALFAIVAQIPPPFEQITFAQAGGDISYPEPWNERLRDLTVRHALNLAARHLGPKGGWVLSGSSDFRTVGFHNREIHYSSLPTDGR